MNNKHWYVIYTRANAEKKLSERLSERSIENFLPLSTVTKIWSDRKKVLTEPLFKSYVFVRCDVNELHKAKTTAGFSHYISFGGYPVVIPEKQIDIVKTVLRLYSDTCSMASRFVAGDSVSVIAGPLKGMNGTLISIKGKKKVAIKVNHLEQFMLITLPEAYLIKMEKTNESVI